MNEEKTIGLTSFTAILGSVISNLRKKQGVGQDALARKLNITASTLSRMENGESSITVDQLYALSSALEIKPHQIIQAAEKFEEALRQAGISSVAEKSELLETTHAVFKGASLALIAGPIGSAISEGLKAAKDFKGWGTSTPDK